MHTECITVVNIYLDILKNRFELHLSKAGVKKEVINRILISESGLDKLQ